MRRKYTKDDAVIPVIAVCAVILIVLAVVFAIREQNKWERWCEAQGGRVDRKTETHYITTFNNGQVGSGTATSTTYYCLNSSGGIIDIQ